MRLVALRMPLATTRTLPKWRVKRTRMRSASAKSLVLRTIASARYVRDATSRQWYETAAARPLCGHIIDRGGFHDPRGAYRGGRRRDPHAPAHRGHLAPALLRDDAVPARPRRAKGQRE